jgi:hypothetical protein
VLNYYQPRLLPFLKLKKNRLPSQILSRNYLSFEDGLWDLINTHFPGRKLHFLVPDFYCSDVLDNIKSRGHKYTYYPLDDNFQTTSSRFRKYLWLFHPDIVIIFHACGLTSDLLKDVSWFSDLPDHSLIIEDSVHRLVDPSGLKLLNTRHFVMDSLRKVSPLPGSRMFGSAGSPHFTRTSAAIVPSYFFSSLYYFFIFRLALKLGFLLNSARVVAFAHERLLKRHDDLIGDSRIPGRGLPIINRISCHFNYEKISALKTKQVGIYQKHFRSLFKNPRFYKVNIPVSDYSHLHVYPLGVRGGPDEKLIKLLHSCGIPVWFKFTDVPWSQKRGVLFLPLGFHVSEEEIRSLAQILPAVSYSLRSGTGADLNKPLAV